MGKILVQHVLANGTGFSDGGVAVVAKAAATGYIYSTLVELFSESLDLAQGGEEEEALLVMYDLNTGVCRVTNCWVGSFFS